MQPALLINPLVLMFRRPTTIRWSGPNFKWPRTLKNVWMLRIPQTSVAEFQRQVHAQDPGGRLQSLTDVRRITVYLGERLWLVDRHKQHHQIPARSAIEILPGSWPDPQWLADWRQGIGRIGRPHTP